MNQTHVWEPVHYYAAETGMDPEIFLRDHHHLISPWMYSAAEKRDRNIAMLQDAAFDDTLRRMGLLDG